MNQPTPDVAPFRYYVQMVLPAVYGDELSYYEVLAKVTEKLNEVIENLNKQGQNVNDLMAFYNQLKAQVDALENEVDAIKNGEYVHLYLDSIINLWRGSSSSYASAWETTDISRRTYPPPGSSCSSTRE